MKIGIYLGSFDPIHIGHLSVITTVQNANLLDYIYVVPAYTNPWKNTSTSIDDRILFAMMALEEYPRVHVKDYEKTLHDITNQDKIYSYQTLEYISSILCQHKIFIIITTDTYFTISKWENGNDILNTYKFIIVDIHEKRNKAQEIFLLQNKDKVLDCPRIDVSSTMIRNMFKDGVKWLYPYLPIRVNQNIIRKRLYLE